MESHEPTTQECDEALQSFFASVHQSRVRANTAKAKLQEVSPFLIQVIATGSGQGAKVEELLWPTWNGDHKIGLCDSLTGLDTKLAEAALAMLTARAFMGVDADPLLKKIITESRTELPKATLDDFIS
jgi:hypothetical protein